MKCISTLIAILTTTALADEWPVIDGLSPNKKLELVTIPKLKTDPANGPAYRIALRSPGSDEILDSFLYQGDISDPDAHTQNHAYWSPNGNYVAINMRSGRLSATTSYFAVIDRKLAEIDPPDAWQNVLGRFGTTQAGPNGGISPVKWKDKAHLEVAVIGSAETEDGRKQFHYLATFRFYGDRHTKPGAQLVHATPKQ